MGAVMIDGQRAALFLAHRGCGMLGEVPTPETHRMGKTVV